MHFQESVISRPLRTCAQAFLVAGLVACHDDALVWKDTSSTMSAWNQKNDPRVALSAAPFEIDFQFDPLKSHGSLSSEPWSSPAFGDETGGLAQRFLDREGYPWEFTPYSQSQLKSLARDKIKALSAAEKLDIYLQRYESYDALNAARLQANPRAEEWHGLGHGVALASVLFEEPHPVSLTNPDGIAIPFGSGDIKGYLAMVASDIPSSEIVTVGERCEERMADIDFSYDKPDDRCRDLNAGAWHVLLTNLVRPDSPTGGLIIDASEDYAVGNASIASYDSTYEVLPELPAGSAPTAVKAVRVRTTLAATEMFVGQGFDPVVGEPGNLDRHFTYPLEYILEIDARGDIVGGRWVRVEAAWYVTQKPDFAWFPKSRLTLEQIRAFYANSRSERQGFSWDAIERIYRLSTR